jgi:hypothetical protein
MGGNAQASEDLNADEDAWNAAEAEQTEDAEIDLLTPEVNGENSEFDNGGKGEGRAYGYGGLQIKEEDEDWRGNAACAYSGEADGAGDEKAKEEFHIVLATAEWASGYDISRGTQIKRK